MEELECHLINENWLEQYKKFYLYNDLIKEIQSIIQSNNGIQNNKNKEEMIYNKLNNEFIEKIKVIENKYS